MVTEEEMKLREMLLKHAGSKTDMGALMKIAAKLQGTNMESYPERYIPKQAQIHLGQPTDEWKKLGISDSGLSAMRWNGSGGVYGLVPRDSGNVFMGSQRNQQDNTLAHELEHVGQNYSTRPYWGIPVDMKDIKPGATDNAKQMTTDVRTKTGFRSDNMGELLAHLSAMEATAPVGTSWENRLPWTNAQEVNKHYTTLDNKRRPDLDQPLGPLPHPNVKLSGQQGGDQGLLTQLRKLLGM